MKSKALLLIGFMLFANSLLAQTVNLPYEGFYSRLALVSEQNYQFARVNFYLVTQADGSVCPIEKSALKTEANTLPLIVTSQGQVLLPINQQLKKDKALLVIETKTACTLKMSIEAEHRQLGQVSQRDLWVMFQEFDDLYGRLAGFFGRTVLSFMLPDLDALTLRFRQLPLDKSQFSHCHELSCALTPSEAWQSQTAPLAFAGDIEAITPKLAR